MRAGTLRHRIKIQQFGEAPDPITGAMSEGWADMVEVWASITAMSGREFIAAQATQGGVTTKILIRHREGLKESMRILQGADVYNIKAILPDPTLARHLNIMAEKGVNNG